MKPEFRPISVTIVDLMGAIFPGTIWLVLLVTFGELIQVLIVRSPYRADITVFSAISVLTDNRSLSFYVFLFLISFFIGFSTRQLVLTGAERLCAFFLYLWGGRKKAFDTYMFPYNEIHQNEEYYKEIVRYLNEKFYEGTDSKLPSSSGGQLFELPRKGTQPFSACKRVVRILSPLLWEETEAREAAVRMLGSMFLSAIFSLICALLALFVNSWRISIVWIVSTCLVVTFLAFAYRRARNSEVVYAYLNFLVAIKFRPDVEGEKG